MKTRFFARILSLLILLPGIAGAQDFNIIGDTIRVSSSAFPLLSFMGEIRDVQPLCSDYRLAPSTTTLTIRPNVSKPVKVCRLLVSEGSKGSPRQHQFVLVFDKEADPADQIHDYSTKDLMERRIDYLEKMKKVNGGGGDEETAKEFKGKKRNKKSKKEKEDESSEEEVMKTAGDVAKNAKAPDVQAPKLGVKTPKAPAVKAPEVKVPEVKAPEIKKPGVKKPDVANTNRNSGNGGDEEGDQSTARTTPAGQRNAGSEDGETGEQGDIENIPNELIEGRVKQKVKAFYKACELLCTKTDIDNTIKYGMKLFDNNEDALVETTNSKSGDKSAKKIRQYFTHLSQLNYKKVEMTASDIKFVSKFHLGPDKKWHASAVIIQDFKGFRDNSVVYKDLTNKTIDIIINTFEEEKDGQTVTKFEIYLGNISVTNIPS